MTASYSALLTYRLVPPDSFLFSLSWAQLDSERVGEATTPAADMPRSGVRYYLTLDGLSGYGVTDDGELIGVFSIVKGRGDGLIGSAIRNGADRLDCFDGFLPELYARYGFRETGREPNWISGKPDVVFMKREA